MTYTNLSKEAKEYLEFVKYGISKEDERKAFISLSFGARLEVQRFDHSKYYNDSNKTDYYQEHFSDSKKYKLELRSFKTGKSTWNVMLGTIFANSKVIQVQRNYTSFPFCFIENHPNGHDYLICAEDYQGHTIIELDTGNRYDCIPGVTNNSFAGFCITSFTESSSKNYVLTDGCFWGGPYEYRCYDFNDPLSGLKHIDVADDMIVEAKWNKNNILNVETEYEYCVPLNKKVKNLSDEEEATIDTVKKFFNDKYSKYYRDKRDEFKFDLDSKEIVK